MSPDVPHHPPLNTTQPNRPPPRFLRSQFPVGLLYVVISTYIFGVWVWSGETPTTAFNGDPRSKLSGILYGTAEKPYVQRVLVPLVTRFIRGILPEGAWYSMQQKLLAIPKVQKETLRLGWETEFLPEYLIALTIAFLFLCGLPFVIRRMWSHLYETDWQLEVLVPILCLLCLPALFPTGPHYIYDFPALFFFTLGLLLIYQRRWLLFYPLFVLGCLNKESNVLLVVAYIFTWWNKENHRTLAFHTAAQLLCFGIIETLLMNAFAANAGQSLEFHVPANIHILLLGYSGTELLTIVVLMGLVIYDFSDKPWQIRRSSALIVPFALLMFLFGIITERRDAYELLPVFLFLILHTIFFSILRLPHRAGEGEA